MKRPAKGSTVKQYAYARNKLGGKGKTKKEIARLSGFSPSVAANAKNKIENTVGFQNAVLELAVESQNMVMAVLAEYKARGLSDFSNKDLNGALNAIAAAWEKFEKRRAPNANETPEGNPLRKVFMQKVENQTINVTAEAPVTTTTETKEAEVVSEEDPGF